MFGPKQRLVVPTAEVYARAVEPAPTSEACLFLGAFDTDGEFNVVTDAVWHELHVEIRALHGDFGFVTNPNVLPWIGAGAEGHNLGGDWLGYAVHGQVAGDRERAGGACFDLGALEGDGWKLCSVEKIWAAQMLVTFGVARFNRFGFDREFDRLFG